MKCVHWLLVLSMFVVSLTGCIESLTEIVVQKDGSGFVYQASYMNIDGNPLAAALGQFGAENAKPKEVTVDEEGFAKAAGRLGEGVRLEWVKKKQNAKGWDGILAKYAFDDVTQLQLKGAGLGISHENGVIKPQENETDMTGLSERELKFDFSAGDTSELTMVLPAMTLPQQPGLSVGRSPFPGPSDQALEGDNQPPEAQLGPMMAMLGPILEGARFLIRVRVDGEIVETDASYVSKKGVVGIMDLKLADLFANKENLQVLQRLQGMEDEDAIRAALADVKGLHMELQPEVSVKFQ